MTPEERLAQARQELEAHHQRMVTHFVKLFECPGFGPDYARMAVDKYIRTSGCLFPKIGHDVKKQLDLRAAQRKTDHGSPAQEAGQRRPRAV